MARLIPVSAEKLSEMLRTGEVELIDVRDGDEYARERIAAARNVPLSQLPDAMPSPKTLVFTCRSGNRTNAHAERLSACACAEAYVLEGGLDGWKKAGLPVALDRKQPLEMMRQVQLIAGGLILLGLVLGALFSPYFALVSAFVGAGLMVAGATGFCGMARLLKYAPWNRQAT